MSFIMYRSLSSSSSSSLKTHRDDVSPLERSIADVVRDLKATRERVLRDVLATAVSTDTTDAREVENSSPIADALDQAKRIIENFDRAGRSNAREDEAESIETLRSVVESVSDGCTTFSGKSEFAGGEAREEAFRAVQQNSRRKFMGQRGVEIRGRFDESDDEYRGEMYRRMDSKV